MGKETLRELTSKPRADGGMPVVRICAEDLPQSATTECYQEEVLSLGKTPIAYIVFNRPAHTRKTFEAIRAYRPHHLFIIADGPRKRHPDDKTKCAEVRSIVSDVDWPCKLHFNFSDENLGCGYRVSSGLDWVFQSVDRAIVLEDDCLASPEFFVFCDILLDKYRDDPRVWMVNGNSYQPENHWGDGSYYFSKYQDCWGWATWRRAWKHYDHEMSFLRAWQSSDSWRLCFPTSSERKYFSELFSQALRRKRDVWDYQWDACVLFHGGLAATPNANLVLNIGFDREATHTKNPICSDRWKRTGLTLPIHHPENVEQNIAADEYNRINVRIDSSKPFPLRALARVLYSLKRLVPSENQ